MKKLSKLDLAAKVKILNENEMKHLKGGYSGCPPIFDPTEACAGKLQGWDCCWWGPIEAYRGVCGGTNGTCRQI